MVAGKILVIKLGALGDFVQALGPMKTIRAHHKDDHITLLTTAPFRSLAQESGYFDDIILDTRPKFFQLGKWMRLRKVLNEAHFTRIYDLQNNDRTDLYARLLSPKAEWVGAGRGATIRNDSPDRTKGLAFYGHVQTLGLAGITGIEIDKMDWIKGRDHFAGLQAPYVLFVTGSAPTRPEKRWPAEFYADIANRLAAFGVQPVLIGTAAEEAINAQIKAACPAALDLSGQTSLADVVALARKARAAIGNDTGPVHMIAPTDIPTLVLFSGKSEPHRHAPLGNKVSALQIPNLKDLPADFVWGKFSAYVHLPS